MNTPLAKFLLLAFSLIIISACTKTTTVPNRDSQNNQGQGKPITNPHPANWKQIHGGNYLSASNTCSICHGEKLDGGKAKVSCYKCHATYPHAPFWAKPENHGAQFAKVLDEIHQKGGDVQLNECITCHTTPSSGVGVSPKSGKNINCGSCHVKVPHDTTIPSREGETLDHSAFGNDKALQSSCLSCHKSNPDGTRKFMPNVGNCNVCHAYTDTRPRVKWISDKEMIKVDALLEELRKNNP